MNKGLVLKNCRIIGENEISDPIDIRIQDGRIAGIGKFESSNPHDLCGKYVCAGFIDIHTHGGYSSDFMDATEEAFDNITRFQIEHGTTTVLATSLTASKQDILNFLACTRRYMNLPPKYARIAGAHLEGPFLSLKGCGAQNPRYLMDPEKDDFGFIIDHKDIVRIVTIAPELDKRGIMTRALTQNGICVSGGHDDGAYPEFMPAVKAGLTHLTHIYCAMSGFGTKTGVRMMGLREFGLWDDRITCEIIADDVHITPEMTKFILKCKGADRVALVSDALRCAGMPPDGKLYTLGSENDENALKVKVAGGIAVLEDGSKFAGSITSVHEMVKKLIASGVSPIDAVKMGTSAPASVIGEKDAGAIKAGFRADLCVLNEQFDIESVYRSGEKII